MVYSTQCKEKSFLDWIGNSRLLTVPTVGCDKKVSQGSNSVVNSEISAFTLNLQCEKENYLNGVNL